MARADRGVAQRYAAKNRKRRIAPNRASAVVVERIGPSPGLEEIEEADDAPEPGERSAPRRVPTAAPARVAARVRVPTVTRRSFASYAEEYRYVLGDLRRVALTAGSLLLILIVLSFFIR